jgi:hypothetical protein
LAKGQPRIIQNGVDIADGVTFGFFTFFSVPLAHFGKQRQNTIEICQGGGKSKMSDT